jgi:hypothetical protein
MQVATRLRRWNSCLHLVWTWNLRLRYSLEGPKPPPHNWSQSVYLATCKGTVILETTEYSALKLAIRKSLNRSQPWLEDLQLQKGQKIENWHVVLWIVVAYVGHKSDKHNCTRSSRREELLARNWHMGFGYHRVLAFVWSRPILTRGGSLRLSTYFPRRGFCWWKCKELAAVTVIGEPEPQTHTPGSPWPPISDKHSYPHASSSISIEWTPYQWMDYEIPGTYREEGEKESILQNWQMKFLPRSINKQFLSFIH